MARFWGGFAVASALWAAACAYLVLVAGYGPPVEDVEVAAAPVDEIPTVDEGTGDEPARRRRGRRRRADGAASPGPTPTGDGVFGDDLREDEPRTLDLEGTGGEQQLRPAQIEAGFDGAMSRIRRCLVLVEGDAPVQGTLTFGLRIQGSGAVEGVRLSGPRAVTSGEAGTCLASAARAIRFDAFDGPTMVVRYPITLE